MLLVLKINGTCTVYAQQDGLLVVLFSVPYESMVVESAVFLWLRARGYTRASRFEEDDGISGLYDMKGA